MTDIRHEFSVGVRDSPGIATIMELSYAVNYR